MADKILIIGGGEMQLPLIIKAKKLGLKVIVTDYSKEAPGLSVADFPYVISTNDLKGNLEIAIKHNVSGVITSSDFPVNTVAYICEEMGLSGLSIESAKYCTNKYLQRQLLSSNNVNVPFFINLSIEPIDYDLLFASGKEYVIKPFSSSGSRGVHRVRNRKELDIAYQDCIKYSNNNEIILEEYIDGQEYSVETLIQNNICHIIAITEKVLVPSVDSFVEECHIIPADIENTVKERVEVFTEKAVRSLSLNNCAVHLELKINSEGNIYIIEVGGRLGGDFITSHLVPLSTGIDMLENALKISLAQPIDIERKIKMVSAVKFLTSENFLTTQKFISENQVSFIEKEIKTYKDIPTLNSLDRLGYYILQEETRSELLKNLNYEK